MSAQRSSMPGSCPVCPHYNAFHAACRHPLHQLVVRELAETGGDCPVFGDVRARAMRNLEGRLD